MATEFELAFRCVRERERSRAILSAGAAIEPERPVRSPPPTDSRLGFSLERRACWVSLVERFEVLEDPDVVLFMSLLLSLSLELESFCLILSSIVFGFCGNRAWKYGSAWFCSEFFGLESGKLDEKQLRETSDDLLAGDHI